MIPRARRQGGLNTSYVRGPGWKWGIQCREGASQRFHWEKHASWDSKAGASGGSPSPSSPPTRVNEAGRGRELGGCWGARWAKRLPLPVPLALASKLHLIPLGPSGTIRGCRNVLTWIRSGGEGREGETKAHAVSMVKAIRHPLVSTEARAGLPGSWTLPGAVTFVGT